MADMTVAVQVQHRFLLGVSAQPAQAQLAGWGRDERDLHGVPRGAMQPL